MIVSLNEVEVLACKAFAGAGRQWGLAQEAGRAVAVLEARKLAGASSLLALIQATDAVLSDDLRPVTTSASVWQARHSLCPILVGAFIADMGGVSKPVTLMRVHVPILLVPFLSGCELAGHLSSVCCERVFIEPCSAPMRHDEVEYTGPVDIEDEIWEGLSTFAHRTYVPASEASRLKGAGAGLTDND